jgi:hypothetical protein
LLEVVATWRIIKRSGNAYNFTGVSAKIKALYWFLC